MPPKVESAADLTVLRKDESFARDELVIAQPDLKKIVDLGVSDFNPD